jgi:hypothetical protein
VDAGNKPSPRYGHAMAYDAAHGLNVLFGGMDQAISYPAETWLFDGGTWQLATPVTSPAGRRYCPMVYDAARARVVLFSGDGPTRPKPADTWEWDGTSWHDVTPAGASPPARSGHAMAYDAARGLVVLYGGQANYNDGGMTRFGDTWVWDGGTWAELSPVVPPPALVESAMTYDVARQRVVLFGGVDGAGSARNGVYEWDGVSWAMSGATMAPSARNGHAMSYFSARATSVTFGGVGTADTWLWDGVDWQQCRSATPAPAARYYTALAPDSAGRVVVFGGRDYGAHMLNDTYLLEP